MAAMPAAAPTRFDLVLLAIGLALAGGAAVSWVSSLPAWQSAVGAAALAGVAMAHGLVVDPPA